MSDKTQWQPIETAPRDQSWILAYYSGELDELQSNRCVVRFSDGDWRSDEGVAILPPTAWTPLPEAPQ